MCGRAKDFESLQILKKKNLQILKKRKIQFLVNESSNTSISLLHFNHPHVYSLKYTFWWICAFMIIVFITIYTSGFGITAGVHRLWSHKAYKAKWPLRLLLVLLFTITGQVRKLLHKNYNFCIIFSLLMDR